MERDQDLGIATNERPHGGDGPRIVASRRRALDQMRTAIESGESGAFLITGQPGSGKSWLVGRLAAVLPASWHGAQIDLTSALSSRPFAFDRSFTGRAPGEGSRRSPGTAALGIAG